MLDAYKLWRRAIVVIERCSLASEIGIKGGKRIVHRHRPAHNLLLVVADGSYGHIGAEEDRANQILENGSVDVKVMPYAAAIASEFVQEHDYVTPYVNDLGNVLDMEAIRKSGIKIGVDPLGGAGVAYWDVIAKTYGLNIEVVNYRVDPTFSFMTLDKDGKIRMDCSSPWAMAIISATTGRRKNWSGATSITRPRRAS